MSFNLPQILHHGSRPPTFMNIFISQILISTDMNLLLFLKREIYLGVRAQEVI